MSRRSLHSLLIHASTARRHPVIPTIRRKPSSNTTSRSLKWPAVGRGDVRSCRGTKIREDNPMPSTAGDYWKTVLDGIDSPTAMALREQLDMEDVTGVPKRIARYPPCLAFMTEIKKRYPDKIIVVQVGDFYEAAGLDAVVLVGEAGLTPVAADSGLPRAGFPVRNLSKTLKRIVQEKHLSMVVCNQLDTFDSSGLLRRVVSAVYNPGDQSYDNNRLSTGETSCILCISHAGGGYGMAEFRLDRCSVQVTRNLTEDALWGRLASGNIAAPICVHVSLLERMSDWQRRIERIAPHLVDRVWKVEEEDALEGFLLFLRGHGVMPATQTLDVRLEAENEKRRQPSFYTASQLGMTRMAGIPSVIDAIVPSDALVSVKGWFRELLSEPRSEQSTHYIQTALKRIADISESLPPLRTELKAGTIAKVAKILLNFSKIEAGVDIR